MTSKANSGAAAIQDIQDENILREMWMESQDADSKREIRSRMYKLREERLKDYYGQEGILETILKPTVGVEEMESKGTVADTTTLLENTSVASTVTRVQTVSVERHVVTTPCISESETGGGYTVEEAEVDSQSRDDTPHSRMAKNDRSRQYREVKASQGISTTTSMTTTTSTKTPFGERETNGTSTVIVKSVALTTEVNGVADRTKFSSVEYHPSNHVILNEKSTGGRRRGGGGNGVASTNTNLNSPSLHTSRRGAENKKGLEERENNINCRKKSGESRRGKRDTTEVQSNSSTATQANRNISSRARNAKASDISSKNGVKKRSGTDGNETQKANDRGGRHTKETAGGKVGVMKTVGGKVEAEEISRTVTNCATVVSSSQDNETGAVIRVTQNISRNTKTSKDNEKSSGKKSRESSPRSRLLPRNSNQSMQKTDNDLGAPKQSRFSSHLSENLAAEEVRTGDEPEKVKAEESIIRELDILDNFLSQRSTSIDDGQVVRDESSVKPAGRASGRAVNREQKAVEGVPAKEDVMHSGLEPPFTKTVYKHGCPSDRHDKDGKCGHHRHPSSHPSHARVKNVSEKKKPISANTDYEVENMENEIIKDEDVLKQEASRKNSAPKGRLGTRRGNKISGSEVGGVTVPSGVSSKVDAVTKEQHRATLRSMGPKTSDGGSETVANNDNEIKRKRRAVEKMTGASVPEEAALKMAELQRREEKYTEDILSRPSVLQKKSVPEPNPRSHKSSDSSPERMFENPISKRTTTIRSSPPARQSPKVFSGRDEDSDYCGRKEVELSDDDEESDVLKPQKRFEGGRGKGLESPGAVLKAKSLFETKAQEAAVDRSSVDFEKSVSSRGNVKVSRKAALFEARSRGERVSISSDSSHSLAPEDKEIPEDRAPSKEIEQFLPKNNQTDSFSQLTSQKVDQEKVKSTSVTRRHSEKEFAAQEMPRVKHLSEKKSLSVETMRRDKKKVSSKLAERRVSSEAEGKDKDRRGSKIGLVTGEKEREEHGAVAQTVTKAQCERTTKTETTRAQKILARRESKTVQQSVATDETINIDATKNVHRTDSRTEIKNSMKKGLGKEARVKTASTIADTSVCTIPAPSIPSPATTTTVSQSKVQEGSDASILDVSSIEEIENVSALEILLDKATDYDERSKIRARIRVLKKKCGVEKEKPSEQLSIQKKGTNVNAGTSGNCSTKSFERRRSSSEIATNKVATQRKSRLTKDNDRTEELSSIRRRASASNVKIDGKTGSKTAGTAADETSLAVSRKKSCESVSEAVCKKGNEKEIGEEEKETTLTKSTTEMIISKTESKRRNSNKGNELLSTRKYSRENNDENESTNTVKPAEDRKVPVQSNFQLKGDSIAKVSNISTDVSCLDSSSTAELTSTRKSDSSRRSNSRDFSPRNLDSVVESPVSNFESISIRHFGEIRPSSSREVSPVRRRDRDSVSPQRSSGIPLSTRRYSRDSCSPPKSPAPFSTVSDAVELQKSESTVETPEREPEMQKYESVKQPEKETVHQEIVPEECGENHGSVSESPSPRKNSTSKTQRKNSEELNLASSTRRRDSSDQLTKGNIRKKSSEEPKVESSGGKASSRSSYSRRTSSKELRASGDEEGVKCQREGKPLADKVGVSLSEAATVSSARGTLSGDRKSTATESRKSSYTESRSKANVTAALHTSTTTPVQRPITTNTPVRSRLDEKNTAAAKGKIVSGEGGSYGGSKIQNTDTVTSSYGVGPTDDDGQPLFGLRALRKIKQVQERIAAEREAEEGAVALTETPPDDNQTSLRSNNMYGLRALKKSSVGLEPPSSSLPPSSVCEAAALTTSATAAADSLEERNAASSPKSILKKTSSFTSNNSESRTDIMALGSSSPVPSHPIIPPSEIKEASTPRTPRISDSTSPSPKSRAGWTTKSKSPEPASSASLSRGKVGRSSVREMSKRFEGSTGVEGSDVKQGNVLPVENNSTDVSVYETKPVPLTPRSEGSGGGKKERVGKTTLTGSYESDDSLEGEKSGQGDAKRSSVSSRSTYGSTSVTKSVSRTSSRKDTRSFLSDKTPVKNLSDVMDRMRGEECDEQNQYISTTTDESDLSLLNKFIGAQIILQGVEPFIRMNTTTTTMVSMSQNLCINGVDVGEETDAVKLKQLLDHCEVDEERRIIQNRLKSLEGIESGTVDAEEKSVVENSGTVTTRSAGTRRTSVEQTGGESSTVVSGELTPLIFDELLNSVKEGRSASGVGGGGGGGSSFSASRISGSQSAPSVNESLDGEGGRCSNNSSPAGSGATRCEEEESSEECLFDSGTESGEDLGINHSKPQGGEEEGGGGAEGWQKEASAPQLSSFLQGLRHSLHNSPGSESTSALVLHQLGVGAFCPPQESTQASTDSPSRPQNISTPETHTTCDDSNLIERLENVLSLLKDSLARDPNCLSPKSGGCGSEGGTGVGGKSVEQGKELIALIERLKSSLFPESPAASNSYCHPSPLPTVVGPDSSSHSSSSFAMAKEVGGELYAGWSQPRPPDLLPLQDTRRRNSNPWTGSSSHNESDGAVENVCGDPNRYFPAAEMKCSAGEEGSWKMRASKRRSHARSHTVGVSVEELAEARRYLEEQAMRSAMADEREAAPIEKEFGMSTPLSELVQPLSPPPLSAPPEMVSPFTTQMSLQSDLQKRLSSVPRPFVKGEMSSVYKYPDVARTTSCDDSSVVHGGIKLKPFRTFSLDSNYDPSKSLFTPEENVQIAIHKAAIKKQMSEEEDRRNRRSSLTTFKPTITQPRDFSLALPKPYSPRQNPSGSQSGSSGNSPNTKIVSISRQLSDSGFDDEQNNTKDKLFLYEASQTPPTTATSTNNTQLQLQSMSPKRIENVQISLKELNSSEFPQLQIAITLNTNTPTTANNKNDQEPLTSSTCQISSIDSAMLEFNTCGANSESVPLDEDTSVGVNEVSGDGEIVGMSQGIGSTSPTNDALAVGEQFVHSSDNNSKICRYKTKTERKKKMKRANTIDIPHPPGYLFSNTDDAGMQDEGATDLTKSLSQSHLHFQVKTEGDKKFLAFLEKNNALADKRQIRPSYLSVNDKSDKFWNNRFYNLKTSFESSSQGSSPSISPSPLSPGKAPRSVSELALHHGKMSHDVYSKPVWANTDPAQLPPQVKNKLHVFENRMTAGGRSNSDFHRLTTDIWRSPPPSQTSPHLRPNISQQHQVAFFPRRNNVNTPTPQNIYNSNSKILLTQRKMKGVNVGAASSGVPQNVQRPVAVKAKGQTQAPQPETKAHEGVHMVHATASALQAMNSKSQFIPPPPAIPPRSTHPVPHNHARSIHPEKINLPWAKKDPQEITTKDAPRIQMSKALFEQTQKVTALQPQTRFSVSTHNLRNSQQPLAGKIVVHPVGSASNHGPAVLGARAKPLFLGATRSFDESLSRKLGAEAVGPIAPSRVQFTDEVRVDRAKDFHPPPSHPAFAHDLSHAGLNQGNHLSGNVSIRTSTNKMEFQANPVSAFARQVSNSEPPSRRNSEDKKNGEEEEEDEAGATSALVLTPVVTRVMRGPTQQRATVMSNRMSSLSEHSTPSRLTTARSNIRNILNQYQPSSSNSLSPAEDSQGSASDVSPPIVKGNLQLTLPPLAKSHSGDAVLQTQFRTPPTNNSTLVLKEKEAVSSTTLHAQSRPQVHQPRNPLSLPPKQQQSNNAAIPRQRSLAEFPRTPTMSLPTQLTIDTETPSLSSSFQHMHTQPSTGANSASNANTASAPPPASAKLINQPRQQQQSQAAHKTTTRAFPCIDLDLHPRPQTQHLQRTSSGTSIFNRTQHLFISAHEAAAPLAQAAQSGAEAAVAKQQRPKPPALPRSQVLFPKQFEAQMSPQSADKKKREVEEYFRQQSRMKQKKDSSGCERSPLRKSASHSKIMHRQRSISDGEEDVDLIFESLFKASVDSKSINSAEAVVVTDSMSATKTVECQQLVEKVSSRSVSSSCSTTAATATTTVSQDRTSMSSTSSIVGGGKSGSPFAKFKQMDQQTNPTSTKAVPLFKFTNQGLQQNATSAKDILLYWCQCRTRDYQNIKIENFSSSWSDGLAFCALIHHFYPDAFDYDSLDAKNRRYNFDLAFRMADEKAGIYPLLDTEDMVAMGRRPDWKCVFTYVQSMYRKLKELA